MLYREAGDFKGTYRQDQQLFPIRQDRIAFWVLLFAAFAVVPFFINDYWENAILVPFFIYSIAAIGLNILTGYCGQVSLGTGGFMAVGAYSCYKLTTAFPEINLIFILLASGAITAAVGVLFGLPSLRIKGFYLAVATLAAQFFIVWLANKWSWLYNHSATGQILMPERTLFGQSLTGPNTESWATYLFCLSVMLVLAFAARNILRGRYGRSWMAIRDMDIAAEIIGVSALKAKLSAFAVSSFYVGVAGAMLFSIWLDAAEAGDSFSILLSFQVLFMIIIGGLGSMLGSFLGAGFIVLLPIFIKNTGTDILGMDVATATHIEFIVVGTLIILFLILEPHGMARLWLVLKQKLRIWPFPH